MSDKDKVVSEDEQDISQEQEALQIEKTVTPLSSPVRELTPDSPILPQYGSQPPPVLRRLHTGFRNMAQLPKRKAPSYQELEANRERFKKVLRKNKILSEKDAKNPQEGKRLFAFKHTNPKSRDKLEQEKMLLQDMRAEQNLSASELRQIDFTIYMIEQEIKNLAEDLCAGPVSKSQKREGPSGDRDPGAGICSITVRRHTGTVICKSELNQEIDCHRKQMRTLLDAKFKRQKCIIKLQKQVDIDTSTIVFYQNLALKGEIKLLFFEETKKEEKRKQKRIVKQVFPSRT